MSVKQTIKIIFTRRDWNLISVGIRLAVPDSFCKLAPVSHCLIEDGEHLIEASMLHGVRRVPRAEALRGSVVVAVIEYEVPDAVSGLAWGRLQVGKGYDFKGAFGLGIAPDRDWQEDDCWFCFELAAAILVKAGLDIFADTGRISGTMLMQIRPRLRYMQLVNA